MSVTAEEFEPLRAYLGGRGSFSDDDFALVRGALRSRTLSAGECLQRAGDVATHAAFVSHGCLRSYVIDAKGREHVVQFAPEDWWLADTTSLATHQPSQYFFEAIEDSAVLLLDAPGHLELVARVPAYASSFQGGLQRHAAAKDQRIVTSLTTTAAERYDAFLETYPTVAQRVPQWMVASYLGLTPETVSRIRAAAAGRRKPSTSR